MEWREPEEATESKEEELLTACLTGLTAARACWTWQFMGHKHKSVINGALHMITEHPKFDTMEKSKIMVEMYGRNFCKLCNKLRIL